MPTKSTAKESTPLTEPTLVEKIRRRVYNNPIAAAVVSIGLLVISTGAVIKATEDISNSQLIIHPQIEANAEVITDAFTVTFLMPEEGFTQYAGYPSPNVDRQELQRILQDKRMALLDWAGIKIRVANLTKDQDLIIDKITINVKSTETDERLLYLSSAYTGAANQQYEGYEILLTKEQKTYNVLAVENSERYVPSNVRSQGEVGKDDSHSSDLNRLVYHQIPPGKTQLFAIGIDAADAGLFEFDIVIQYSIGGKVYERTIGKGYRLANAVSNSALAQLRFLEDRSYTVAIGSYGDAISACNDALLLGMKGFPAFVDHPSNSQVWFLRLGTFGAREEALQYESFVAPYINSQVAIREPENFPCWLDKIAPTHSVFPEPAG